MAAHAHGPLNPPVSPRPAARDGAFPATRWTLILAAQSESPQEAKDALARFCELYWPPLYVYLRRKGETAADAEDYVQGFFQRLIEGERYGLMDQAKGRLRTYLLHSLRNFVANQKQRERAVKRGGRERFVSIHAEDAEAVFQSEPATEETPEAVFERRWAITLLEKALDRLEREQRALGKGRQFETLRRALAGSRDTVSYADLGAELGMSEGAARVASFRLRQSLKALIREAIEETVASDEEADEELAHWRRALAR